MIGIKAKRRKEETKVEVLLGVGGELELELVEAEVMIVLN